MERVSGYALALASFRLQKESHRRFLGLGKPHVLAGGCLTVSGYLFQIGGMLGRKYACKLDIFAYAFLGAAGEPGAIERFFRTLTQQRVLPLLNKSSKVFDFVLREMMNRASFQGDMGDFILASARQRLDIPLALDITQEFASYGAALGAIYPERLVALLQRSFARRPDEEWEQMYRAGLDISEQQPDFNYSDFEAMEDSPFLEYCHRCCPEVLLQLTS